MNLLARVKQRERTLSCIIFLFLICTGYLAYTIQNIIKQQAIVQHFKTLDYGASRIEAYLNNVQNILDEVSMAEERSDERNLRTYLERLASVNAEITEIMITDDQGKVVYASNPYLIGMDIMERTFFRKAQATEAAVVSNKILGQSSGKPITVVAVPYYSNKQFAGVISATLDPNMFNALLMDIIEGENNVAFTVIDNRGSVLASSKESVRGMDLREFVPAVNASRGERGSLTVYSPVFEDKRLYVYKSLQAGQWGLLLSKPLQDVYAPILHVIGAIAPLLVLCTVLILGMGYQVMKLESVRRTEALEFQAEKANAVSEIAASVAHEIRNPITGIRGFMQLLANRTKDPKAQEYAQLIVEEVDRVEQIISEFLSLAKPHSFRREKCELHATLRSVYLLAQGRAVYNGVDVVLECEQTCTVLGDEAQLKQVFLNLSTNAIQAMPRGGTLTISCQHENGSVVVRVKDTGIGIRPEHLSRLGERFFTTKEQGSGLGLAVVYRLIENHRGNMRVRSLVGEGTVFTVILPAYRGSENF